MLNFFSHTFIVLARSMGIRSNMTMSNPDIPVTPADDSHSDNQQQQETSTQASTPVTDTADQETKDVVKESLLGAQNGGGDNAGSAEDVEEMDTKAKALMHLLNTSEVCILLLCL